MDIWVNIHPSLLDKCKKLHSYTEIISKLTIGYFKSIFSKWFQMEVCFWILIRERGSLAQSHASSWDGGSPQNFWNSPFIHAILVEFTVWGLSTPLQSNPPFIWLRTRSSHHWLVTASGWPNAGYWWLMKQIMPFCWVFPKCVEFSPDGECDNFWWQCADIAKSSKLKGAFSRLLAVIKAIAGFNGRFPVSDSFFAIQCVGEAPPWNAPNYMKYAPFSTSPWPVYTFHLSCSNPTQRSSV